MTEPISTCAAGSAALPSRQEQTEFAPFSSARSTQGAGTSSAKRGRACRAMTTSEPSIGAWSSPRASMDKQGHRYTENMTGKDLAKDLTLAAAAWPTPRQGKTSAEEVETWQKRKDEGGVATPPLGLLVKASGSCQQAFPASQPAGPGSNEARKMTAGSGRRLSGCLAKSDPLGLFSRILLESETWASPEFYLTWKLKATKCGCSVFQLAPSVPRTGGSDTGLFAAAWPTTTKRDHKGQTQHPERMDYVPNIVKATWPTPASQEVTSPRTHLRPSREETGRTGGYISEVIGFAGTGPATSGCLALTESFVVRLTTLSAWLMGYTGAYLAHWATASCRKSRRVSSPP